MHSMALSTPADGGAPSNSGNLKARDGSAIPAEPPSDLIYRHEARLRTSIRDLWASRDIIYTLAERDIRAQYKQATLGLGWALIAPCAMLGIFIIIFSRTKALGVPPGVPYPLFAFIGILSWTFFAQALGTGGTALLMNHDLMSKTQFPRECFPLETHAGMRSELRAGVDPAGGAVHLLPLHPARDDSVGTVVHPDRGAVHHRAHARGIRLDHPDARPRTGSPPHHSAGFVHHAGHLGVHAHP